MSSRKRCWLCSSFASRTLKAVVRHIGAVHSHEANFHIKCDIQGCVRTYTNFFSFKNHVYRNHKDALDDSPADAGENSESLLPDTRVVSSDLEERLHGSLDST